jgi:hypothetical protein
MKTLKELVTNTTAKLSYICAGILYYEIAIDNECYQFPINSLEIGNDKEYWQPEYKAITLMRWIRQAIKENILIQTK